MKKLLLLFLFIGVAVPGLMAQDINIKQVNVARQKNAQAKYISENRLLAGDNQMSMAEFNYLGVFLHPSLVNKQTTAIISQIGNRNTSIINQSGKSNYGAIYINGNDNRTKLSQVGDDFSVLVVKGHSNHFEISQTAAGVRSFIKLENTYGLNIQAEQNSRGMTLKLFGGTARPMTISITGQNIPVIISTHY